MKIKLKAVAMYPVITGFNSYSKNNIMCQYIKVFLEQGSKKTIIKNM